MLQRKFAVLTLTSAFVLGFTPTNAAPN